MKNRLLIGASDKLDLLLHFIQNNFSQGVTVIDPDGRLARAVADIIPSDQTEEALYFDPSDAVNVASFNVFQGVREAQKPKLVQDLCAFFDAMFPAGSETLTRLNSTYVLANVLTIILDSKRASFLSVLNFLSDIRFRSTCLTLCRNPMALRNWTAIEEWDGAQRKAAFAQIEAKLGTLLLSPLIHRTLIDDYGTFYPGKTRIFVADLSRSKIGDAAAKLLGTLLISRATTPVYVNDFGFFASDYLASFFSRGGYTIALQYLEELNPSLQQHVLGFSEKYVFRATPEDADRLKFAVGLLNPARLVELSPSEFLPKIDIRPPTSSGRFRAVLKRSVACHTRKKTILLGSDGAPLTSERAWS